MDAPDPGDSLRGETGLKQPPFSKNQDLVESGWACLKKKAKKTRSFIVCCLESPGWSEGVIKRQKLVILDVQSSCLVCSIIFPSSYLLEFDDKSPHLPPSLSLPLFSLSLLLSLSLSPSMYMVIGWLFSQHWRGLNLLCLHPLWSVPCVRSLSISSSENKHNKLLKRCQRGDGLQNQPWYDKCNRCSFHPFVSKRPECRSEPKKNRKNSVAFVTVRAAAAEEPRTWRRETPFHFITGKCGRETSANTILT